MSPGRNAPLMRSEKMEPATAEERRCSGSMCCSLAAPEVRLVASSEVLETCRAESVADAVARWATGRDSEPMGSPPRKVVPPMMLSPPPDEEARAAWASAMMCAARPEGSDPPEALLAKSDGAASVALAPSPEPPLPPAAALVLALVLVPVVLAAALRDAADWRSISTANNKRSTTQHDRCRLSLRKYCWRVATTHVHSGWVQSRVQKVRRRMHAYEHCGHCQPGAAPAADRRGGGRWRSRTACHSAMAGQSDCLA